MKLTGSSFVRLWVGHLFLFISVEVDGKLKLRKTTEINKEE